MRIPHRDRVRDLSAVLHTPARTHTSRARNGHKQPSAAPHSYRYDLCVGPFNGRGLKGGK